MLEVGARLRLLLRLLLLRRVGRALQTGTWPRSRRQKMYRFGVLVLLIDLRRLSNNALETAAMSTHGIAARARRELLELEKDPLT
jgi:hypothetical protein